MLSPIKRAKKFFVFLKTRRLVKFHFYVQFSKETFLYLDCHHSSVVISHNSIFNLFRCCL
uniref:Uncharacterized protein n=1 Tax=Anguilla anguilla TaxID=7936 RepID=A0A0E9W7L8_ANGAN